MQPEEFSISRTSLAECDLIVLRGELDGETAPEVTEELAGVAAGGRAVVIDLSELSFIDSGGLHALMRQSQDGRKLCLVCPEGNVSRVLSIVRFERVMPVYGRLEDALAALR